MLARILLVPLALVVLSLPVRAQYGDASTTIVSQPSLAAARINEEGTLVIKHITPMYVPETHKGVTTVTETRAEQRIKKEKRIQDGQVVEVDVPYTVNVPVEFQKEYLYTVYKAEPKELEGLYVQNAETKEYQLEEGSPAGRFYETNGQAIPAATLASRLKDWQPILLTDEGRKVEDYYTYIFKPGTIVAALPVPKPMLIEVPPEGGYPAPVAPADPNAPQAPTEEAPKPNASALEVDETFSVAFQAEAPEGLPKLLPPTFAFAKIENNQLSLRTVMETQEKRTAPALESATPAPQGAAPQAPAQVELLKINRTHDIWQMPLTAVKAQTAAGQKLRAQDLAARLPREATVLISKGGQEVEAFWLKGLSPQTLILITPIPDEPDLYGGHGGYAYGPEVLPVQQTIPQPEPAPQGPPDAT